MERCFLLDKLPSELLHTTCAYLKPTEVANLCLLSRAAALVDLHYLVPEVRLNLAKDSFKELRAMAEHPIVSKIVSESVTSFVYEADRVHDCDREEWDRIVLSLDFKAQLQDFRAGSKCLCDHERTGRTYERDIAKLQAMPCYHYYGQGLDKTFLMYQGFCELHYEDQIEFHAREIANAMQHFPKLKKVRVSTDADTRPHTYAIEEAFSPEYSNLLPTDGWNQTLGVLQMRSLPLALQAGIIKNRRTRLWLGQLELLGSG